MQQQGSDYKYFFTNSFAFGGSTITTNIMGSHPGSIPLGELQEEFRWGVQLAAAKKYGTRLRPDRCLTRGLKHLLLHTQQPFFFDVHNYKPRTPPIKSFYPSFVEFINNDLKEVRLKSDTSTGKKDSETAYTSKEIKSLNPTLKLNGGLIFLTQFLNEFIPNAYFLAIPRHPLALGEGYLRRGLTEDEFINIYRIVIDKMLQLKSQNSNYHIIPFEIALINPFNFYERFCDLCDLKKNQVSQIRVFASVHYGDDGGRGRQLPRDHYWFDKYNIRDFIKEDMNQKQISKLSNKSKDIIWEGVKDLATEIGYTKENSLL